MHRHAIGIGARFKLVAKPQLEVALMPEVRVVQLADLLRPFFNQHALFKIEQVWRFAAGLLPPLIKVASGDDIVANALVVKLEQRRGGAIYAPALRFPPAASDFPGRRHAASASRPPPARGG